MAEPTLRLGSRGTAVHDLQEALSWLGYHPGAHDGQFGNATLQAVRSFQSARGLPADGVVGDITWRNIDEADHHEPVLRRDARGLPVRRLQYRMQAFGYDVGGVDGRFGARTETAVRTMQTDRALVADGIVGAQTWAVVDSLEVESPPVI